MTTSTSVARIGIMGAGNRGVRCFGDLINRRGDARIVALADTNPVRAAAAAELLGSEPALYNSFAEMLANAGLDGVVITTPDYLHAPHVLEALESGVRHVLVDKPLATTVEGCRQVREAARQSDSSLSMGFNLRHVPVIERIKQIIDNGEIGDIMLIENREFYDGGRTYFGRWNGRREFSGGLWIHKGSHDFDVYNWWNSKGTPVRVMASAGVNALREDKVPFDLQPGKTFGPDCPSCAYNEICPDVNIPAGGNKLFNSDTAASDGYRADKCIFLADTDVHDNGIALVEYSNNVRASHLECFVCGFDDRMYTVVGDRGTVSASLANPTQIELRPRWGSSRIIDVPEPDDAGFHGGADPLLVENFIQGIHGKGHPSSSVRDGLRAVAIGEAAEIAWRERRSVEIGELVALEELE